MQHTEDIAVREAASPDELEAVFGLRYESYLRKGYIREKPGLMMSDVWDRLAVTTHIVAVNAGKVVGAVRLIGDSPEGLPMERVFPGEISSLRGQGHKLAEASTMVAHARCDSDRRLWLQLCMAVWGKAEALQIDDLCVAVTENHLHFYERLLFERLGEVRRYASLNGILAYPLRLRVAEARAKHRTWEGDPAESLRKRFLG